MELKRPFERVAMDLLDTGLRSRGGNRYILVVTEYYSGWKWLRPLPDKQAEPIAAALANIIMEFGSFKELLSDLGTEFVNAVNDQLCDHYGIDRITTSAYHPQTDGVVERSNAIVEEMTTAAAVEDGSDWDLTLPATQLAINTAAHLDIGVTPYCLMFGRDAVFPESFI